MPQWGKGIHSKGLHDLRALPWCQCDRVGKLCVSVCLPACPTDCLTDCFPD